MCKHSENVKRVKREAKRGTFAAAVQEEESMPRMGVSARAIFGSLRLLQIPLRDISNCLLRRFRLFRMIRMHTVIIVRPVYALNDKHGL